MTDLLAILAATGAEPAEAGNALVMMGEKFGLKPSLIIAQAINFAIVAFLLWQFAFKPVVSTIEERQKKIADGLQYAKEMKESLAESERRQTEMLREAREEAQKIVAEARSTAESVAQRTQAEAAKQATETLDKAKETIERERKRMLAEVRGEVSRLVVQTSAKVLDRTLDETERNRLSQAAASEIAGAN